jgi:DNA invertase Pin-like site-specific DNA recombinase
MHEQGIARDKSPADTLLRQAFGSVESIERELSVSAFHHGRKRAPARGLRERDRALYGAIVAGDALGQLAQALAVAGQHEQAGQREARRNRRPTQLVGLLQREL